MNTQHAITTVQTSVGFQRFAIDAKALGAMAPKSVQRCPGAGQKCRILRSTAKSFAGVWEQGLVGGFMNSKEGIKVLVLYTERPMNGDSFDFDLVVPERVKPWKAIERKAKDLINYRKA